MSNLNLFESLDLETERAFMRYHRDNPMIWELFKRYASEMRSKGRKHYGAKSIMERVRWHFDTENLGEEFKINNNFTAYYARALATKYPNEFGRFFEFREVKGLKL